MRIARKHINWQLAHSDSYVTVKPLLMQAQTAAEQLDTIDAYFSDCHRESFDLAC